MNPTKTQARDWLFRHKGQKVKTYQVTAKGGTWTPGPRTLTSFGVGKYKLDGSVVEITRDHRVLTITQFSLTIEWLDENGQQIHYTTYTTI